MKRALLDFFSSAGRTSVVRMLIVVAIAAPILWLCAQVSWELGLAINALAGAILGATIAKLGVEARRRVRDAGYSKQLVGWVWLALGLLALAAFLAFAESDPDWAQWAFVFLEYAAPLTAALFLLTPGRRHAEAGPIAHDRWGPIFAAVCIVAGTAIALLIAIWSAGVRAELARNAAFAAERAQ